MSYPIVSVCANVVVVIGGSECRGVHTMYGIVWVHTMYGIVWVYHMYGIVWVHTMYGIVWVYRVVLWMLLACAIIWPYHIVDIPCNVGTHQRRQRYTPLIPFSPCRSLSLFLLLLLLRQSF